MTRIALFSTQPWVRASFEPLLPKCAFEISWLEPRLTVTTAGLAAGHDAVCAFVNDQLDAATIGALKNLDVRLIALRCAGYNNVDLASANAAGIGVVRVPAYSPYAVAEHALGLMLCLNRRYHRAWARVREGNFELDGLLGFDMHGKTVGVVGTGRIGQVLCTTLRGFGCRVLAFDTAPNAELAASGTEYVDLDRLYRESDIVSLHCPLVPATRHMIDAAALDAMKPGVMIVNTSRGALIDTPAVIRALKSGKIGYLGLDVYEEEQALFSEDLSDKVIQDDMFVRLESFPNVLITAHQAFFTKEAVENIASTTLANIREFLETGTSKNLVPG